MPAGAKTFVLKKDSLLIWSLPVMPLPAISALESREESVAGIIAWLLGVPSMLSAAVACACRLTERVIAPCWRTARGSGGVMCCSACCVAAWHK